MALALFYIVHVIISLFLIGVVLLQQGKGADLSVFGGGSTMTAFGARSATNILHRLTVVAFIGFIVTTLSIGVMQRGDRGSTVMSDVPVTETAAETETPAAAGDEAGAAAEVDPDSAATTAAGTDEASSESTSAPSEAAGDQTVDDAAANDESTESAPLESGDG